MSKLSAEQQNENILNAWLNSKSQTSTDESFDFLTFVFEPQRIFKYLIAIISCLVILNSIAIFYQHGLNGKEDGIGRLIPMFSLNSEASIPSTYSSIALLLCSVLLAIITKSKYRQTNRYRRYWKFLSIIFLYLAIDEAASIHELGIGITYKIIDAGGFFYYAWVIPAIILFSLFSLIYLKFVLSLPKKTRLLFILSAATFMGGAVGVEMICGKIVTLQGENSLIYALMTTVEETLEMVGIAVFIYTLTDYLKKYVKPVIIRF